MNYRIIVLVMLMLFRFADVIAQETEKENNISTYLHKLDSLEFDTTNLEEVFNVGYHIIYNGQNKMGNALMQYALSFTDSISDSAYQAWSIRNTKNGNYAIAIDKLEKAMLINPEEISAYYGWVLLYYYRDYEKALKILEQYDAYTPNFADAPSGEDIHYLKGLCHFQMKNYKNAVKEFDIYITNLASTHGEDFVDVYTFVQKGRSLTELGKFDEAILSFKKAISYYKDCTEAYYFMGLTQVKMKKQSEACINFNIALDMINQGEKSNDVYVELFHEIYPQQIQKSIDENCK